MRSYKASFLIDAPVDRVWELLADPNRLPEWNGAFDRVENVTGRLDEPGTVYTQVTTVAGVEFRGDWQITGVDAPHWRTFSGTPPGMARCSGTETLEADDGGTRYRVEMDYCLIGGPAGGLIDRLVGRETLARIVENNVDAIRRAVDG